MSAGVRLFPVDPEVTAACRFAQAVQDFRVLCPTLLPRPFVAYVSPPSISAGVSASRDSTYLQFGYGAPVECGNATCRTNVWRNEPCCFLHFDVQREHVYGPPRWHPKQGRPATLGAKSGWLQPASSASYYGGAYFGNHDRFFFTEARTHYVVTLHHFGTSTVPLLSALIRGLRPVEPLPAPLPSRTPGCRPIFCRKVPLASVAVTNGTAWAADTLSDRILRFNATNGVASGAQVRIRYPTRLVTGPDGTLWSNGWQHGRRTLEALDPSTGRSRSAVEIGHSFASGLAVEPDTVWATDSWSGKVSRVDAVARRIETEIPSGPGASAVTSGYGAVWVANTGAHAVAKIDPASNRVERTVPVGRYPQGIVTAFGAIWVTNTGSGTVSRIDPGTAEVVATIRVGLFPVGLIAASGRVWVANFGDGTVSSVDPGSNSVSRIIPTEPSPYALAATPDHLLVAGIDRHRLHVIEF